MQPSLKSSNYRGSHVSCASSPMLFPGIPLCSKNINLITKHFDYMSTPYNQTSRHIAVMCYSETSGHGPEDRRWLGWRVQLPALRSPRPTVRRTLPLSHQLDVLREVLPLQVRLSVCPLSIDVMEMSVCGTKSLSDVYKYTALTGRAWFLRICGFKYCHLWLMTARYHRVITLISCKFSDFPENFLLAGSYRHFFLFCSALQGLQRDVLIISAGN